MLDSVRIRGDFPILARRVGGKPLVYLDSGATSQKPVQVLLAEQEYYERHNANVHRGAHTLGDEATAMLGEARQATKVFVGATSTEEIIFVRNTTEAINLVAYSWGADNLKSGDLVLSTLMEHHANLVPWQQAARRAGARVELVGLTDDGQIDMDDYQAKLRLRPKMVALVHISNALGTINPVGEMTRLAHNAGALVLVDGAQAVAHLPVNVREIGCDFYAFSGHKMLGPMGIGVLWGKKKLLEQMSPFMTGGGMIAEVYPDKATFAGLPDKFEAGTPNVAGAVGLGAATLYLTKLGMKEVQKKDAEIVAYALEQLSKVGGVTILGPKDVGVRGGSVSFEYRGVHAHDVATVLDSEGVEVRSGHHCTMPLHNHLGVVASIRASFNVYTTKGDIDALVVALGKVKAIFGR